MLWFGVALLLQDLGIESTMHSALYKSVLDENVRPFIQKLKLN